MISQHQYFPISLYLNTNILQYHLIQCVTDVPCCGCTRSRLIYAENSCGHCASIIVNCSVHNIQDALFIQSNTMNFVMNKARKYKVFETQASAALFGLGCVSLCGCSPPQIWSSGPRAKWLLDKTSGQGGQRAQEGQEGQRDCWVIVALELVSCLGHGWFSCETSNLRSLQYLSFKRRCTDRHFGEDIRQRERGRGNRVGDRWRDRDWVVVALELVSLVGHWPAEGSHLWLPAGKLEWRGLQSFSCCTLFLSSVNRRV